MNIFVLDESPEIAAQMQCDKHVVKMCLESAQILNGALHDRGLEEHAFYGYTHKNHPCTLWAAESWANFSWLCRHLRALSEEYKLREQSDEEHLSYQKVMKNWFNNGHVPDASNFQVMQVIDLDTGLDDGMTEFALATADDVKCDDPVKTYRDYYRKYKNPKDWFSYKKSARPKPVWL